MFCHEKRQTWLSNKSCLFPMKPKLGWKRMNEFFCECFFLPRWRFRNFRAGTEKKDLGAEHFPEVENGAKFRNFAISKNSWGTKTLRFRTFFCYLFPNRTLLNGTARILFPPYAAALFEPTSLELHLAWAFEGTSTDWATAPRLPYRTLFNHGQEATGHLVEISTYRKVPQNWNWFKALRP